MVKRRGDVGRFAKGKIHCSCGMCRTKSYDTPSHTDRKKFIAAQQQIDDIDVSYEKNSHEEQ